MSPVHAIHRTTHGLTASARAVLARGRYAVLGTENPDGSVHLVPVMYALDGDRIVFETDTATRKARNLAARRRCTMLVMDPAANDEAWVSASGPVEIVTGPEREPWQRRMRARYLTEEGERVLGGAMARYDDAAVVVTPDRWLSWDVAVYNAVLAADGIDFSQAAAWFR